VLSPRHDPDQFFALKCVRVIVAVTKPFGKSDQILRDCQMLVDEYDASLWRVHETAGDAPDLEARLLAFYGVGRSR
jgi:hypothetical protein